MVKSVIKIAWNKKMFECKFKKKKVSNSVPTETMYFKGKEPKETFTVIFLSFNEIFVT